MSRANFLSVREKQAFSDAKYEIKDLHVENIKSLDESGLVNLQGNLYGDGVYSVGAMAEVETAALSSNDGDQVASLSNGVMKMTDAQIAYQSQSDLHEVDCFESVRYYKITSSPRFVDIDVIAEGDTLIDAHLVCYEDKDENPASASDINNFVVQFFDSTNTLISIFVYRFYDYEGSSIGNPLGETTFSLLSGSKTTAPTTGGTSTPYQVKDSCYVKIYIPNDGDSDPARPKSLAIMEVYCGSFQNRKCVVVSRSPSDDASNDIAKVRILPGLTSNTSGISLTASLKGTQYKVTRTSNAKIA